MDVDVKMAGRVRGIDAILGGHTHDGVPAPLIVENAGGRTLVTNGRAESVLEGITRTSVLELGRDLGYKTKVGPITKQDFFGADEAFYCGTAVEIIPIVTVTDGSDPAAPQSKHLIGAGKPGPVAVELIQAFQDAVAGRAARYEKWLTYVGK